MELRDLPCSIAVVGILGVIGFTSLKSCYYNHQSIDSREQIQETQGAEPTTGQVRFGQYIPSDANSR